MADEEKEFDVDALEALEKEAKEFDKDAEIDRILKAFRLDAYSVLNLQPGIPSSQVKAVYRRTSLLIHPDKTSNPLAPEAFDRLAKAHTLLLDDKAREKLDEAFTDARMLLIRERKLDVDDEIDKETLASRAFLKDWREKTKQVLMDDELRRRRQMKAQMQEEGRQKKKEEEEAEKRKRKRDHETAWEESREKRIDSWRDFQKGKKPSAGTEGGGGAGGAAAGGEKKKKKKLKPIG